MLGSVLKLIFDTIILSFGAFLLAPFIPLMHQDVQINYSMKLMSAVENLKNRADEISTKLEKKVKK